MGPPVAAADGFWLGACDGVASVGLTVEACTVGAAVVTESETTAMAWFNDRQSRRVGGGMSLFALAFGSFLVIVRITPPTCTEGAKLGACVASLTALVIAIVAVTVGGVVDVIPAPLPSAMAWKGALPIEGAWVGAEVGRGTWVGALVGRRV